MKKGLVLCGGGSKGSYEMGAWTALKELNEEFNIVTGTSIGCLNGAMYAQKSYDKCLELWNKIEIGMIMESGFNFENNSIRNELKKKNDMLSFFGKYVSNMGTDIKPFWNLMDKYIDEDRMLNSDITFGICCAKFPSMKGFEVVVNKDMDRSLIKQYICASASCFPIFPVCKIGKDSYVDGGYYDNLPINFAINLGATDLVVIDLSPNITHPEYLRKPFVRYIHPTRSLGSFMHFDRSIIDKNMTIGYNDTMKSFNKFLGYRYTFNLAHKEYNTRSFLMDITKKIAYIGQNKLKTLVKPEANGDIFNLLEMYTDYKRLDDFDYFLRALEISAEIYDIDYVKVYNIDEFICLVLDKILEVNDSINLLDGYSILNANRKKDYIFKLDDKALLKYLLNRIFGKIEEDVQLETNVYLAKPTVFIAYYLFKNLFLNGEI